MGFELTDQEILRADTPRFESELGQLVTGELIAHGESYMPPDEGGEGALLLSVENPPNEGGEAKPLPIHTQDMGELAIAHAA